MVEQQGLTGMVGRGAHRRPVREACATPATVCQSVSRRMEALQRGSGTCPVRGVRCQESGRHGAWGKREQVVHRTCRGARMAEQDTQRLRERRRGKRNNSPEAIYLRGMFCPI